MTLKQPGVTYGIGGYDDRPGNNIVERVTDNGDGTGTWTTYGPTGDIVTTGPCEVPAPRPLSNAERFAQIPPEKASAILVLSGGLVADAEPFWTQLVALRDVLGLAPGQDTEDPTYLMFERLTDRVLTAALSIDPELPELP